MKTTFITLALLLSLCVNISFAQWVQQAGVAGWDIDFIDANTGWYIGDSGSLKKSTDGGITWTAQTLGVTNLRCRGIDMIDANLGFICTELGGKVYRTTNGGTNWTMIDDLEGNSLYDIDFLNATTGIAVGFGSRLIKTTNAGVNWTDLTFSGNGDFYDVYVESAAVSYITTSNGRLLKSTNIGNNYSQIHSESSALSSIMFLDLQTGFVSVGGNDKGIIKTTNGGVNWVKYRYRRKQPFAGSFY